MPSAADILPEDIIFLDIETVPCAPSFTDMSEEMQKLWEAKSKYFRTEEESPGQVWDRAGIYAEFGKIICISVGIFTGSSPRSIRLKSFFGDDEKMLLAGFASMLARFRPERDATLCAHNGKEFDFPFIARRMIINRLPVPKILDNSGKKPWEVRLIDTMDMWKFGDYKHFTSLSLLTTILGIPSPKDDIDGSMVAGTYYDQKDLKRIVTYCEKDTVAVAQVFLVLTGEEPVRDENMESVTTFSAV